MPYIKVFLKKISMAAENALLQIFPDRLYSKPKSCNLNQTITQQTA